MHVEKIHVVLETCPNHIKKTWSGNQLFSKYESIYRSKLVKIETEQSRSYLFNFTRY